MIWFVQLLDDWSFQQTVIKAGSFCMFMSSSLFAPTRASVVTTAVQGMFSFGANGSD